MTSRDDRLGALTVAGLSFLGLLAGWSLLAVLNGDPSVLPGPWIVGPLILRDLASGELLLHLGVTLRRVAFAFVLSMSIGVALGLFMGRSAKIDRWFDRDFEGRIDVPHRLAIVFQKPTLLPWRHPQANITIPTGVGNEDAEAKLADRNARLEGQPARLVEPSDPALERTSA